MLGRRRVFHLVAISTRIVHTTATAAASAGSTPTTTTTFRNYHKTTFTNNKLATKMGAGGNDLTVEELWNGSNEESFYSVDHPGYTLESDPTTHLGGWHAHRAAWEDKSVVAAVDDAEGDGEKNVATTPSCWIKEEVMDMITKFDYSSMPIGRPPRILVLYGSLRPTSFSRKLAYEFARLLDLLGCDVRIYNPRGLPVRDPALEKELKVQELRALTMWSDGHMWVSPGMFLCVCVRFCYDQ